MGGEPEIIAQDRGEGMDRAIEDHRLAVSENKRGHGHRDRPEQEGARAVDRLEDQGKEDRPEGDPDHRLVHVGDRGASRDQYSGEKPCRLKEESASCKHPRDLIAAPLPTALGEKKHNASRRVEDPGPAERVGFLIGGFKRDLPSGRLG